MISEELLKKVRQIEVFTRKRVTDVMSGQYRSQFKGQGMQFSEHRQYLPGDDIRHIDWKLSARAKDIFIKQYEEERELTVLLAIDVSGSEHFGAVSKLKSEAQAEVAAMLAFAAESNGDRVGAIFFSDRVEKVIPPGKGRGNLLRIIREILQPTVQGKGTSIKVGLEGAARLVKHSGVVFLLTDFLDRGYEISLKKLARKHDVIVGWLSDPLERSFPPSGVIQMQDAESGEEFWVDTSSYAFKKVVQEESQRTEKETERVLKSSQVDWFRLRTEEDYTDALVRYFRTRSRHSRR